MVFLKPSLLFFLLLLALASLQLCQATQKEQEQSNVIDIIRYEGLERMVQQQAVLLEQQSIEIAELREMLMLEHAAKKTSRSLTAAGGPSAAKIVLPADSSIILDAAEIHVDSSSNHQVSINTSLTVNEINAFPGAGGLWLEKTWHHNGLIDGVNVSWLAENVSSLMTQVNALTTSVATVETDLEEVEVIVAGPAGALRSTQLIHSQTNGILLNQPSSDYSIAYETGLSVSITPTSLDAEILVSFSVLVGSPDASNGVYYEIYDQADTLLFKDGENGRVHNQNDVGMASVYQYVTFEALVKPQSLAAQTYRMIAKGCTASANRLMRVGETGLDASAIALEFVPDSSLSGKIARQFAAPYPAGGEFLPGTSYTDLTNAWEINLTPISVNSKFLIDLVAETRLDSSSAHIWVAIADAANTLLYVAESQSHTGFGVVGMTHFKFVHEPATTGAVTYKVRVKSSGGVVRIGVNGGGSLSITEWLDDPATDDPGYAFPGTPYGAVLQFKPDFARPLGYVYSPSGTTGTTLLDRAPGVTITPSSVDSVIKFEWSASIQSLINTNGMRLTMRVDGSYEAVPANCDYTNMNQALGQSHGITSRVWISCFHAPKTTDTLTYFAQFAGDGSTNVYPQVGYSIYQTVTEYRALS